MSTNQTTGELPDIRQTILLKAPIQKVWDAVSTSQGIETWFMPNTFSPEPDYEFTITSPYGVSPCKVTELRPPYELSFTWGEDWNISFLLEETAEGHTQFTLVHGGWNASIVTEAGMPHAAVRDRMNHGWEHAVLPRLRDRVEGA